MKKISLQKLYENLVTETFVYASSIDDHPLHKIASKLDNFSSFDELLIQLTLHGLNKNIPQKANFKLWGEDYLIQSLIFIVKGLHDEYFLTDFFTTLLNHKTTKQLISSKFKNICFDLYVDNITKNHSICKSLSLFLHVNCKNSEFYDDFCSLTKVFGF